MEIKKFIGFYDACYFDMIGIHFYHPTQFLTIGNMMQLKRSIINALAKAGFFLRRTQPPRPSMIDMAIDEAVADSYQHFKSEFATANLFPDDMLMMYDALQTAIKKRNGGLFLQFGVATGLTLNRFAKKLKDNKIYGFDKFVGLGEDWHGGLNTPKGAFDMGGKPPKVRKNCELIIGWVEDTLEDFLEKHAKEHIAFAHLDMDLYSPTKFALEKMKPRLQPGSILLFDEFQGFPNWRDTEFKAFSEVFTTPSEYKYISFSGHRAAIEIL